MQTVKLDIDQNIAIISFNRVKEMNSFNHDMARELEVITTEVRLNDKIRAVCLKGEGPLFMAGGDIKYFYEHLDDLSNIVLSIIRLLSASINNITQMSKPILASAHGSVAGVGLSFVTACDLAIASEETKFTTAYSKIGLSPDGGMSHFLPRLVGTKRAMELFCLADVFSAEKAKEYGIINWVVPQEKLAEQTQQILSKLANGPTHAFAGAKNLVNHTFQTNLAEQMEREARYFLSCAKSQDFRSGVNAFINKSKPEFEGK